MKHKTIIFSLVSLIIMGVMLWFIGIDDIIDALKIANLWFILVAVFIQIFTYYLYTLRWKIINEMVDINVGIKKLIPIMLVGLCINNITPSGRGGGEPVRAYILSKKIKIPMEQSFATVIADRALDTFPFIVLAIVTIISVTFYFSLDPILIFLMVIAVVIIVAVLLLLIYMSINKKFGKKVNNWIFKLTRRFYKKDPMNLEKKIHELVNGFQDTMNLLISNKRIRNLALPLSFFIWGFEILRVYIVFLAFGANVSPIIIGEVFIMASLIGMIPVLPGGLGAVDGVMILFYAAAGVPTSLSAAATVIERLISFWMATAIGLILIPYFGSSVIQKASSSSSSSEDLEDNNEKMD